MRPSIHTTLFWLKLIGAAALIGLPLLLLSGCQTTAPGPIPIQ